VTADAHAAAGRLVAFTVHGTPAAQGSKTVAHHEGRSWVREDNRALQPWRNAIAFEATAAMDGRAPLAGPCRLEATFVFARPKSHYRTGRRAGELKPTAPTVCATRPDLDKLLRALGDALTGIVLVDDARIVDVTAAKHYGSPGAHITVLELP
jgi:Holliday junction resolvase RusA-like endonuclease